MSSIVALAFVFTIALAGRDLAATSLALEAAERSLTRIAAAYATAGDEWLTAVAKEAHAALAARAA